MADTKKNTAVLFRNNKGNNQRRPDFTGVANIDGKDFKVAAWSRIDRRNDAYLKLVFTEDNETERIKTDGNS